MTKEKRYVVKMYNSEHVYVYWASFTGLSEAEDVAKSSIDRGYTEARVYLGSDLVATFEFVATVFGSRIERIN